MKVKIVVFVLIGMFLYSCGSSKNSSKSVSYQPVIAPVTNVEKVETKAVEVEVLTEQLPAPLVVEMLTAELQEGKDLYENNCAKCHNLYNRKSFTAEQWTPILIDMQKNTPLTDEQRMKVYNYVTMN